MQSVAAEWFKERTEEDFLKRKLSECEDTQIVNLKTYTKEHYSTFSELQNVLLLQGIIQVSPWSFISLKNVCTIVMIIMLSLCLSKYHKTIRLPSGHFMKCVVYLISPAVFTHNFKVIWQRYLSTRSYKWQ